MPFYIFGTPNVVPRLTFRGRLKRDPPVALELHYQYEYPEFMRKRLLCLNLFSLFACPFVSLIVSFYHCTNLIFIVAEENCPDKILLWFKLSRNNRF